MLRGLLRNVFKTIFSDLQADSWPGRGHDLRLATSDLHHAICKNELNVPIVHVFTCRKVDTFLFFSRKKCYCCSSKFSWDWGGGALKGSLGRAVPPWPSNPRGNPHRKGVGMLVVSLRGVNFGMVPFRGQKSLGWLGHTQIGLLNGFNSKFPTSIPTPFICGVPPGFKPCLRQKSLISLLCLRQETLLSDPDLFCFAYRFK